MGGHHSANLTPDVNFLVVGDRATEKYEFVVGRRPDVTLLQPKVVGDMFARWQAGEDLDVTAELERGAMKVFDGMVINITNMRHEERDAMIPTLESHGAKYVKDLRRSCTHLITPVPAGDKYKYANLWSIATVVPQWVFHSLKRGAALPDRFYRTGMPEDEIGKGAIAEDVRPAAGAAAGAAGDKQVESRDNAKLVMRKRRAQTGGSDLFDSILGDTRPAKRQGLDQDDAAWQDVRREVAGPDTTTTAGSTAASTTTEGMFSGMVFDFQGFSAAQLKTLEAVVASHGGQLKRDTVRQATTLVLYSLMDPKLRPKRVPRDTVVLTEWALERSLHKKKLVFDEWGEFVVNRDLPALRGLSVSISGYSGVELLQLERLIEMLGARYQPVFVATHDLLIATPGSQKFEYAKKWGIPVVNERWLWETAHRGSPLPLDSPDYVTDGLHAPGRILRANQKALDQKSEEATVPPPAVPSSREPRQAESDAEPLDKGSRPNGETTGSETDAGGSTDQSRSDDARRSSRDRRLVGKATVSKLTMAFDRPSTHALDHPTEEPIAASQVSYVDVETQHHRQKLLEVLGEPSLSVTAPHQDQMTPAVDIVKDHTSNRASRKLRAKR